MDDRVHATAPPENLPPIGESSTAAARPSGSAGAQSWRPAWLRWLSLPSALLGIYAFFLPWVYISCGSIKGSITGEEFATGAWEKKIGAAKARQLKERLQVDKVRRVFSPDRPGDKGQTILNPEQPLLWLIPAAMGVTALLIVLRAPRIVSLTFLAVSAGGLAYFKYRFALEVRNARVPGQVLIQWLDAYWLNWAAIALLVCVCLFAPAPKRAAKAPPA